MNDIAYTKLTNGDAVNAFARITRAMPSFP